MSTLQPRPRQELLDRGTECQESMSRWCGSRNEEMGTSEFLASI